MIIYAKKVAAFIIMEVRRILGIVENELSYRRGFTDKFEYTLLKKYLRRTHDFGSRRFYQNYPALDISGSRPCISRYYMYGLSDVLKPDFDVLDIGGNVGFFSLHISQEVRSITIVEYNKVCSEIFEMVRAKERIKNVTMNVGDFKRWNPDYSLKYNLILSLAIHRWIGMDISAYILRLYKMLKPEGLVLIESHHGSDKKHLEKAVEGSSELFEIIRSGLSDDSGGKTRRFYLLKAKRTHRK